MSRGLIQQLRSRIRDERFKSSAFTLSVSDTSVTSAIIEVTRRRFRVTVIGGTVPSVDFDLADDRYMTVGDLAKALDAIDGYEARIDDDIEFEHASGDLNLIPPTEFNGSTVAFHTRLFSDLELAQILEQAVKRHNPSYTTSTLPPSEDVLVLQLAQAGILRIQATDAAKRKGLDETVSTLLSIAKSFEEVYEKDTRRLQRVIASPTLTSVQQNAMREGDIVLGSMYRKSPRNGYMTPMAASLPPDAAVLLEPLPGDEEDNNVQIRWLRNVEHDFYTYELWRDYKPQVQRSRQVILFAERDIDLSDLDASHFDRPTTSKLVFRSFGPNSTRETKAFTAFVEAFGQLVTTFIDRDDRGQTGEIGLEPETDYYYRLYVVNVNGDAVASNVLRLRTKPQRARFVDTDPILPITAAGDSGASITITGNNVVAECRATIGGKQLENQAVTPGSPGTVVGDLPLFTVPGTKDVVLESPTGLFDLRLRAFTVT